MTRHSSQRPTRFASCPRLSLVIGGLKVSSRQTDALREVLQPAV